MITFHPHRRDDIPLRIKWLNNKNANKYLVDDPNHMTNEEEQIKWFDRYETEGNKKFFTIFSDGVPIGFTGLSNIDHEKKQASVFIVIGEDEYRGKGNGKIILDLLLEEGHNLGIDTFTLDVFKNNEPAVRLYTDAGFIETEKIDDSMVSMIFKK